MSDPSFCWMCSKPLKLDAAGNPIFMVVRYGPESHRVHKTCAESHNDEHKDNFYAKHTGRDIMDKALGEEGDDVVDE